MVELMVAAVILGFAAVPIIGCVALARQNASEARVQSQVRSIVMSRIATTLDQGKTTRLVASIVPVTQTIAGGTSVTSTLTIAAVTGYKDLFSISCTATWKAGHNADRPDTLTLTTYATTASLL